MKPNLNWNRYLQLTVVLIWAAILKLNYSTASVNELRWILAPTTFLVELITGTQFDFESHAGYLSRDRTFLIAASCSGINFLITAFLLLSIGKLWKNRSQNIKWRFIPTWWVIAYFVTIVANTVRISIALQFRGMFKERGWLNSDQLHRFEGIFIYFGFLLLLFLVAEKMNLNKAFESESSPQRIMKFFLPLSIYYVIALGIPLVNGAYRRESVFWEHSLFVLLTPMLLIVLFAVFRLIIDRVKT